MGQQKNTVIINGKSYDASTGELIRGQTPAVAKLMTDVVKAPVKTSQSAAQHTTKSTKHLSHHKPQKSTTLKRLVPKKVTTLAAASSMPISAAQPVTVTADGTLLSASNRHERAKHISKSSSISRFNLSTEPAVTKHHQPLPVQPAPLATTNHTAVMPNIESTEASSSEELFSAALSQAYSHKQKSPKTSRRQHRIAKKLGMSARAANAVTVVLVFVALGGFVAYQNSANIAVHLAASRSGLASAELPGYKPSGFSLSRRVAASPGQVTLSFHSNSDARAFTITQASSNWNSQTLADSYLTNKQAQPFSQPDGKTIYLYDASSATWVDGGVWYRIEGNSSLSSSQLLKIADSF